MPELMKILVVEDDDDQLQAYEDAAEDFNTEELHIELITKKNSLEAKQELLSREFDGAIVDLNLSTTNPNEVSGNEVLLEITEKHRFPVLVVSGNLQNLDPDLKQSAFFKTYIRDTPNSKIFEYLLKIFKTGITRILGGRGQIDRHLGEIFWNHLACEFEGWEAGERNSEKTLLRYTIAHLTEYLDSSTGAERHYYHDAEFYIIPPIKEYISTGDIVRKDEKRYIVLSPPCDVAIRDVVDGVPLINANNIVLAPLISVERSDFLAHSVILDEDNASQREKKLDEIIKGNREKYAFLPGSGVVETAIADLQNICTLSFEEFLQAERLATVTESFLKNIQSQFSAYYGRQGQPDLDKKELLRKNKSKLSPAT